MYIIIIGIAVIIVVVIDGTTATICLACPCIVD